MFGVVLCHSVIIQIIVFAIRPVVSYAALDLGVSPGFLGLLAAAYALPALAMAVPAGHAIDRLGERKALIAGAVLVVLAMAAAYAGLGSLWLLVVATVLLGAGQVLTVIGQQAFIGNTSTARGSDAAFGYYGFAAAAGQTIGPLLLALPGGSRTVPPLPLIMLIGFGLACLLLVVSAFVRSNDRAPRTSRVPLLKTVRGVVVLPGLVRALLASSLVLASVDIFVAYAPLIGVDRGVTASAISAMLVARSMASMASRLALGRLTHALGRRRLLVWSITLSAVSLVALSLPLPVPVLIGVAAAYGFVVGICQPVTMSWISVLAPAGTRGLTMSLRLATNRLGQTIIPAGLGTIAAGAGAAGVLGASGAMLVIAAWASAGVIATPSDET
ncbi:Predicted arabinose efflux permease, MFS family [Paramicrobacterium humi]|uniref:Predicted arabinose efflux permease, MFS family n=1 Tax=Paramicrobacterium humi TaxID=640635 RepID=A0A1H4LC19_9MICO|nr:MFS transporter [Microbacterium humi]SEB68264.1 Predicted arabinose efflux permease, MFS family [Microbacterium humi]